MPNSLNRAAKSIPALTGLMLSLLLSACAVGPDFKTPQVATGNAVFPGAGKPTPASEGAAGIAQTVIAAQDIPAQWWSVFHSDNLDQLIRRALAHSPNLAAAQAALRSAQENYHAQSGTTNYPTVTANAGVSRNLASAVSTNVPGGALYNLYNASVNVSYSLDVFGGNRRALESTQAVVEFQQFQVEAAYLALTANVVTGAIREASLRAQIKATQEIITAQSTQLDVIEQQLALGAIPKASALAQRNLLAQTRANLPALEKALQQTRNQLAVYAGQLPGEGDLPEFDLATLQLPAELPLSIPSALVRQRPDIRASEALLHQASAGIGVATANQYPQINLTASYGSAATNSGDLFGKGWSLWSIAGGVTQPIFNAGALSAKKRAAVAVYDQADAQYRATVLTAFQSVADSLQALDFDANSLQQQVEVDTMAKQTLELAQQQYQFGAINSLVLLDAKRTYQAAHIGLIQAQAARYADTAALFQSLGGGWWNRTELNDISHPAQ